jgi:hypothetical protein
MMMLGALRVVLGDSSTPPKREFERSPEPEGIGGGASFCRAGLGDAALEGGPVDVPPDFLVGSEGLGIAVFSPSRSMAAG